MAYKSPSTPARLKWWEKTVEYVYVRTHLESGMAAAPLDGFSEEAGDTVIADGGKWSIIEFKRSASCLDDEEKKYDNYADASRTLCGRDRFHFLIYGIQEGDLLTLRAKTYFERTDVPVEECSRRGTDIETFEKYVKELIALKGSRSGGVSSFASVAIVHQTADGAVDCISLSEYCREMGLALVRRKKKEMSKSIGLSFGD